MIYGLENENTSSSLQIFTSEIEEIRNIISKKWASKWFSLTLYNDYIMCHLSNNILNDNIIETCYFYP